MDVVCSKHIKEDDFHYPGTRKRLKKDALPNVKRSYSTDVGVAESASLPRPPRAESLENQNERLRQQVVEHKAKLKNTCKREIRVRRTVETLLNELQEQKFINDDLRTQLDDFKGKHFV